MQSPKQHNTVVMAQVEREPEEFATRPALARGQFSLAKQFVVVTLFGFLFAAIANIGAGPLMSGAVRLMSGAALLAMILVLLTPIVLIWGVFYRLAPQPTKYATVLGSLLFLPLTLLPCWLLQNREEARRVQCNARIRQMIPNIHQFESLHRPMQPGDPIPDLSEPIPESIVLRSGQRYPAYEPRETHDRPPFWVVRAAR